MEESNSHISSINSDQLQGVVDNIVKQFSSQEKEKYRDTTLSEVATNLLSVGLIFPISLDLNDLREANLLLQQEDGKQKAISFLQEKVEFHDRIEFHDKDMELSIISWELFDIVHAAPSEWKETLDESKNLFLKNEENFRVILPLYYSYLENKIRFYHGEKTISVSNRLVNDFKEKLRKELSKDDFIEYEALLKAIKKNLLRSKPFTNRNVGVNRNSVLHGVLPPSRWEKFNFYQVVFSLNLLDFLFQRKE
ncbi:MAG: hypothetical protein LBT69_00465 [Lactobacillales bacterium]|jgi:hypothetical protein|nr:hypothetical protein [Lactobacillales bacterium]